MKIDYKVFDLSFTIKGAMKELQKYVNENDLKIIQIIESRGLLSHRSLTLVYVRDTKNKRGKK